jgi:ATP-dependent Clp protease ATP-binding subunit ClpA
MAREIDLDGYIIIFTGNINERQFSEQIPPELRSRFDLVCEFEPLSMQEKLDFIEYCINTFLERLSAGDHYQFTEEDLQFFRAINPTSTNNLRDIKRMIQERIISRMKYTEDENGYLTNATIE